MDVGSGKGYPCDALSNFAPHEFVIDGVTCASMEGFLQSLKFDNIHIQDDVCGMVGKQALFRGKKHNKFWKSRQTLWWRGTKYERDSEEYECLIRRAYKQLELNRSFRDAILAAGKSCVFTHSIGKRRKCDTVLTEAEFCRMLTMCRDDIFDSL